MTKKAIITSLSAVVLLASVAVERAAAHQTPSSDLLLPYFEVDLTGTGPTTLVSVVNSSSEPVPVRMTVYSNWGIELLSSALTLEGHEVSALNLNHWILSGQLPDKALTEAEQEHLRAALSGQRSPRDDRYYSNEVDLNLAVGYLTIRVDGTRRPDVLFGDYLIVDSAADFAQGEVLVNVDRTVDCQGLCQRHGLRFLAGGGFDGGTEVVVWTRRVARPSATPYLAANRKIAADVVVYREDGEAIDHRELDLLPVAVVKVSELGLSDPYGWFDLITEEDSFIAVRYSAGNRFSVALQTVCMALNPPPLPKARIRIETLTNGEDADWAPGPAIEVGAAVVWEYVVTNTGQIALGDVVVTDDQGVAISCPRSSLAVGQTMTCTGSGIAVVGQYRHVGTAAGTAATGAPVSDWDPSHYHNEERFVPPQPRIAIENLTNGKDADEAPGATLVVGESVTWTYVVTNSGNVPLREVVVSDDHRVAVSCPQSSLEADEVMTCTGSGLAVRGQYRNAANASGTAPTGAVVSASDPSHYNGQDFDPSPYGGCNPDYWQGHTESWVGLAPSESVVSVFGAAAAYSGFASLSLLQVLELDGATGVEDGAQILLRAAVAAVLNAEHPAVLYPRMRSAVIRDVNAQLVGGSRDTRFHLAAALEADNDLGCPLI